MVSAFTRGLGNGESTTVAGDALPWRISSFQRHYCNINRVHFNVLPSLKFVTAYQVEETQRWSETDINTYYSIAKYNVLPSIDSQDVAVPRRVPHLLQEQMPPFVAKGPGIPPSAHGIASPYFPNYFRGKCIFFVNTFGGLRNAEQLHSRVSFHDCHSARQSFEVSRSHAVSK